MNRENLFRGRRPDNGEWVYGSLVKMLVDGRIACCICPIEEVGRSKKDVPPMGILFTLNEDIFLVDPDTVGEYTGQNAACKDSQGQMCRKQQVFEHDILADQNGNILGCVKFTDERGWMVGVEPLYDYTDRYDEKEALIIGNAHSNPELLEEGEKQAQEKKIQQTYRPLIYPNFSEMDKNDGLFQFLDRRRPYDPSDFVPKEAITITESVATDGCHAVWYRDQREATADYDIPYISHDEAEISTEDLSATLERSKTKLRAALNGKYVDRMDYLSDKPSPNGQPLTDPEKLTPEMREAYDRKCKGCLNEGCGWCKYTGCWDDIFNPLPKGFMEFALNGTPYRSGLVRDKCTDAEIRYIVNKWKEKCIKG